MLVHRYWLRQRKGTSMFQSIKLEISLCEAGFEGWFLFGFIPLYVRQVTAWKHS